MKSPLNAAIVFATLVLSLTCQPTHGQDTPKPASSTKQQLTELEGTWEGTEVGREARGKATLTVAGKSLEFRGADKREWYKATITLPADTDPKQLHGVITESPLPEFTGKTAVSIYKIENGTLTLVGRQPGNTDVPKKFEGEADTRTFVFKKAAANRQ